MVSMDKENNILKSEIKKIQKKYQQLLDEKQSSALGLNFNNADASYGHGYENRFIGRQNQLVSQLPQQLSQQRQQRCLNSQSRSTSKNKSSRTHSISSQRPEHYGLVSRDSTATDFDRKSVTGIMEQHLPDE